MKRAYIALIIALSAVLLCISIASAGAGYRFRCEYRICNYNGTVSFGGGKAFNMITGYCVDCEKFVYLKWMREGRNLNIKDLPKKAPVLLGRIWLPEEGEIRTLYKCPYCGKPFMEIKSVKELKYCPKCDNETLKITPDIMYD